MAIKKFKVENVKALGLAECGSLPKIMIIAGANGSGKSTLLYEISQRRQVIEVEEATKILYQPPHRAIRKTSVKRSWLSGGIKSMFDLLMQTSVSGYEGLSFQNGSRTPDNVDEAGSTIKHTLGEIENKRQAVLAELFDKAKSKKETIETEKTPDIYESIRELTKYLLPHLVFQRIDFKNENDIKCVWKRIDKAGEKEIDIDDLSSGEKAIIILFLPLIENQIHANLKLLENSTTNINEIESKESLVFIVDEPELHLHPDLQAKILTYIRTLSVKNNIQFIISTHSPTILDQAYDDELYLLTQKIDSEGKQNQLKKVASSIEKLEALKQLTGNPYFITTGRSIICIEGELSSDTKPTDIRLLEILYPRSTAYTFVPSGGKGNVINTVKRLRQHLSEENFNISVCGLTDMDQNISQSIEGVFSLPVCMIENLLLVPEIISEYLQKNNISMTLDEVKSALDTISTEIVNNEIGIRISKRLKPKTIRVCGTNKEEINKSLEEQIEDMRSSIPEEVELDKIISETKVQVDKIISDKKALKEFRGKEIISQFYGKFIKNKEIGYSKFCYELAQAIAQKGEIEKLLNPVFDQIKNIK